MKTTATFNRYVKDSTSAEKFLNDHSGERVEVKGVVPQVDETEVGIMHFVQFSDGSIHEAFNDELSEWKVEA